MSLSKMYEDDAIEILALIALLNAEVAAMQACNEMRSNNGAQLAYDERAFYHAGDKLKEKLESVR